MALLECDRTQNLLFLRRKIDDHTTMPIDSKLLLRHYSINGTNVTNNNNNIHNYSKSESSSPNHKCDNRLQNGFNSKNQFIFPRKNQLDMGMNKITGLSPTTKRLHVSTSATVSPRKPIIIPKRNVSSALNSPKSELKYICTSKSLTYAHADISSVMSISDGNNNVIVNPPTDECDKTSNKIPKLDSPNIFSDGLFDFSMCDQCSKLCAQSMDLWIDHLGDLHPVPTIWPSSRVDQLDNHDRKHPYTTVVGSNKKRKADVIPRPLNSFMIFAQYLRRVVLHWFPDAPNVHISQRVGQLWRKLDNQMRDKYINEAYRLQKLHSIEFPDYKYQPKKRTRNNNNNNNNSSNNNIHDDDDGDENDVTIKCLADVNNNNNNNNNNNTYYFKTSQLLFENSPNKSINEHLNSNTYIQSGNHVSYHLESQQQKAHPHQLSQFKQFHYSNQSSNNIKVGQDIVSNSMLNLKSQFFDSEHDHKDHGILLIENRDNFNNGFTNISIDHHSFVSKSSSHKSDDHIRGHCDKMSENDDNKDNENYCRLINSSQQLNTELFLKNKQTHETMTLLVSGENVDHHSHPHSRQQKLQQPTSPSSLKHIYLTSNRSNLKDTKKSNEVLKDIHTLKYSNSINIPSLKSSINSLSSVPITSSSPSSTVTTTSNSSVSSCPSILIYEPIRINEIYSSTLIPLTTNICIINNKNSNNNNNNNNDYCKKYPNHPISRSITPLSSTSYESEPIRSVDMCDSDTTSIPTPTTNSNKNNKSRRLSLELFDEIDGKSNNLCYDYDGDDDTLLMNKIQQSHQSINLINDNLTTIHNNDKNLNLDLLNEYDLIYNFNDIDTWKCGTSLYELEQITTLFNEELNEHYSTTNTTNALTTTTTSSICGENFAEKLMVETNTVENRIEHNSLPSIESWTFGAFRTNSFPSSSSSSSSSSSLSCPSNKSI